jgi:hypothetical protein
MMMVVMMMVMGLRHDHHRAGVVMVMVRHDRRAVDHPPRGGAMNHRLGPSRRMVTRLGDHDHSVMVMVMVMVMMVMPRNHLDDGVMVVVGRRTFWRTGPRFLLRKCQSRRVLRIVGLQPLGCVGDPIQEFGKRAGRRDRGRCGDGRQGDQRGYGAQ